MTVSVEHFNDGSIYRETPYHKGEIHGTAREYYDLIGRLFSKVEYYEGKRHGLSETWYENGNPRSEVRYHLGEKHGMWRWWYLSGGLHNEVTYQQSQKHGRERTWLRSGKLEHERFYVCGKPVAQEAQNPVAKTVDLPRVCACTCGISKLIFNSGCPGESGGVCPSEVEKPPSTCTCSLGVIMNFGCPSNSGGACPNRQ